MTKKYFPLLLLFIVNNAIAQVKHTVTKSTITFQIKNLGFNTGGNIGGVQANILFDPAKPETGTIEATADVSTINTDNDMRDEHLRSESFFNVAKYPKIIMKAVSIKHKGGANYQGQFNVTIKDKTQLIDVPFTYTATATSALFKGEFKLKRSDFGIGGSSLSMSDNVTVNLTVETAK